MYSTYLFCLLSRELSKVAEQFIKQEDEGRFRCKTCQKLFKATSFVEKHIANKHPELVKSLEDVNIITIH
jgi:Arsenite-resistance protein 2